jgi:hypothetical protein
VAAVSNLHRLVEHPAILNIKASISRRFTPNSSSIDHMSVSKLRYPAAALLPGTQATF